MSVSTGSKAPQFTLYNTEKKQMSLSDYEGQNVVLLFFPLAFTDVCSKEMCTIRDSYEKYDSMNAQVLGISVDSLFTLEKFAEEQKINFPLLSDFNKEVSRSYDALYEEFVFDMQGVSKRASFVIDGKGTVRYAHIQENAGNLPDFDAILDALSKLS